MHRFILSTMTLSVLVLTAALAWAAVEAPPELKLAPPEGMKATKALVDFSHTKHESANINCVTCHHTWDQKSEVQSCSVSGCHDQPGKKGENTFYAAFHAKNSDASCLGCHKEVKKQGKDVPVACKACHAK